MSTVYLPYEQTSRYKGAAYSAHLLYQHEQQRMPSASSTLVDCTSLDQTTLPTVVSSLFASLSPRCLVGGEHLLTYYSFLEVQKRHNAENMKLIVFDAHHDAYQDQPLSHYSFIDKLNRELQVDVLVIGARHDLELSSPGVRLLPMNQFSFKRAMTEVEHFLQGAPFYLSFDVDVLDPSTFSSIAYPVKDGMNLSDFEPLLKALMQKQPLFCDLVEFHLKDSTSEDIDLLLHWLEILRQ